MTCALCRNGRLRPGEADKVLTVEGMTLVVKNTPALVCDTCGERYFAADVTQRLLVLARAAARAGVLVDVRRYVAA